MARKVWMKKMVEAAKQAEVRMPFERGAPRAEMIARRKADQKAA